MGKGLGKACSGVLAGTDNTGGEITAWLACHVTANCEKGEWGNWDWQNTSCIFDRFAGTQLKSSGETERHYLQCIY